MFSPPAAKVEQTKFQATHNATKELTWELGYLQRWFKI